MSVEAQSGDHIEDIDRAYLSGREERVPVEPLRYSIESLVRKA